MNTTTPHVLTTLVGTAERHALQIRQLRKFQLLQGVTLLFLGLTQLMQTFAIARGLQ